MNLSYIILILTFIVAVIEKKSDKKRNERKGIWRLLRLDNITITLFIVLLIFQLWESRNKGLKEVVLEELFFQSYNNIESTQIKVIEAHKLVDSVLQNLETEINYTKKEFDLITSLNDEMNQTRKSVEKNVREYKLLNKQYEEQIRIEKEKLKNAKPDLRIVQPKSVSADSNTFQYQFQFMNFGNRDADSVKYHSIMVFADSLGDIKKADLYKTNISEHNTLSISPDKGYTYFVNGPKIDRSYLKEYKFGILLIKYDYVDKLDEFDREPFSELIVLICPSLNTFNKQYSQNTEAEDVKKLQNFLFNKDKRYKTIFIKQ